MLDRKVKTENAGVENAELKIAGLKSTSGNYRDQRMVVNCLEHCDVQFKSNICSENTDRIEGD